MFTILYISCPKLYTTESQYNFHYSEAVKKYSNSSIESIRSRQSVKSRSRQIVNLVKFIQNMMLLKCCSQYVSTCQQIWKTQQWPQDWKRSVFIPVPKKGNAKECSDFCVPLCSFHMLASNAKNPSSQAVTVREPRTSKCTSWVQKRQRNQRLNC